MLSSIIILYLNMGEIMKGLFYRLLEDGNKQLIGTFMLNQDESKVIFYPEDSKEPIADSNFIDKFSKIYCAVTFDGCFDIDLDKDGAKKYLENLKFRFSGYTWVENIE